MGEDSGEGDRQTHQIPNRRNLPLRSVAESVPLSFLWVPAFAGMTARFAKVSSEGEDLWACVHKHVPKEVRGNGAQGNGRPAKRARRESSHC